MFHYIFTLSLYISIISIAVAARFAQATPLYNTDDAQITPEKSCQLEIGQTFSNDDQQLNLSPACTFKNLELTVPITQDSGQTTYAAQLKHPFYASDKFGVALSGLYQPSQNGADSQWVANLPVSFYNLYGNVQINANLGWVQEEHNQGHLSWAIAAIKPITERQQIGLEYYKQPPEKAKLQAVWGIDIIPDKTSLYLSYGQSLASSASRWFGLGLSIAI